MNAYIYTPPPRRPYYEYSHSPPPPSFHFVPRRATADAKIKVPSVENTELSSLSALEKVQNVLIL